jgi:hypothetical protein
MMSFVVRGMQLRLLIRICLEISVLVQEQKQDIQTTL